MTFACFHISGMRCSNCAPYAPVTPSNAVTYVPVSMPSDLAEIERLKKLLDSKDGRIRFLEDMIDDLMMAPDKIPTRSVIPAQMDCDSTCHEQGESVFYKDLGWVFCPKCGEGL